MDAAVYAFQTCAAPWCRMDTRRKASCIPSAVLAQKDRAWATQCAYSVFWSRDCIIASCTAKIKFERNKIFILLRSLPPKLFIAVPRNERIRASRPTKYLFCFVRLSGSANPLSSRRLEFHLQKTQRTISTGSCRDCSLLFDFWPTFLWNAVFRPEYLRPHYIPQHTATTSTGMIRSAAEFRSHNKMRVAESSPLCVYSIARPFHNSAGRWRTGREKSGLLSIAPISKAHIKAQSREPPRWGAAACTVQRTCTGQKRAG